MAMESLMAVVPYLTPTIENLESLLKNEVALLWGVESDMKKLSSTLSTIHDVLEDAEQKQLKDKAMQNWLKELNDVAYEADDILDECAFEALRCESEGQGPLPLSRRSRETSSFITQPQLYGRDEDRDKIVKFLVEDVCDSEDVSVYPILGIGGLGKTTLTQMAFNDERVYVSQDFDVKRVIKATIESANGNACEAVDLDSLQRKLRVMLNGKRYLIVLDDVWDENPGKWDALKSSLACGSKDCWLLFKQRAFGRGNEELPNLVAIGNEIVKKCGCVPIAAKAFGGLMRFKSQEKEWLHVKESEIWNLDKNPILSALRLSYFYLPLESRQCFAYCAIFPKGSEFEREI
ncbi:hypothetical protein ACSBR1_037933 [Camellia fascicularis]